MSAPKAPAGAWRMVALLFVFMMINFADKGIVNLAGVPIADELHLTPRQFGLIGSSFFLLFSISAIVTGFIVNRVQTRWVLLVMAAIWALTQFPMIGTVSFETLIACRILLGAGEGPAYPVALHSAYKWFPNEQRTLPTAVIAQGSAVGLIVATPLLNWVIVHYSWHWAFGALGLAGIVWVILWRLFGREGSIAETVSADGRAREHIPYAQLILNGTVLSAWIASFGAYWGLSLALSWFTSFLIKGLGYAQETIGYFSAMPAIAGAFIVVGAGWVSQRALSRGVSSRIARGLFSGLMVALGGAGLLMLPYLPGAPLKIAVVALSISLPSIIYVIGHAIVSELTPVGQRGAMLAIGNAVATSAGLLAPYVMGGIIEDAPTVIEGFMRGFGVCGVITLIGGVIGMIFMNPEQEAARLARLRAVAMAPAE